MSSLKKHAEKADGGSSAGGSTAGQPAVIAEILERCLAIGFDMSGTPGAGSLLRSLAASKPGAQALDLGTGAGVERCYTISVFKIPIPTQSGPNPINYPFLMQDAMIVGSLRKWRYKLGTKDFVIARKI